MILAILAEAAGTGPVVPTIPTYDYRTGRVYFPGQEKKKEKPKGHRAKRKRKGRMAKASRRKNRRK
jgi:hypothetical protein